MQMRRQDREVRVSQALAGHKQRLSWMSIAMTIDGIRHVDFMASQVLGISILGMRILGLVVESVVVQRRGMEIAVGSVVVIEGVDNSVIVEPVMVERGGVEVRVGPVVGVLVLARVVVESVVIQRRSMEVAMRSVIIIERVHNCIARFRVNFALFEQFLHVHVTRCSARVGHFEARAGHQAGLGHRQQADRGKM